MEDFKKMLSLFSVIFLCVSETTANHMILDGIQINQRSSLPYACDSQGYFNQIAASKEIECNLRLATETAQLSTYKAQCLSNTQATVTAGEAALSSCLTGRTNQALNCNEIMDNLAMEIALCEIQCPGLPTGLQLRTLSTGSYYISSSSELKNWFMADAFCKSNGMELASVETEVENKVLINEFGSGNDRFWISGTDSGSEGRFYWSGVGKVLDHFTFFETGQPDGGGNENCVQYFVHPNIPNASYKWNDESCNTARRFICEVESIK